MRLPMLTASGAVKVPMRQFHAQEPEVVARGGRRGAFLCISCSVGMRGSSCRGSPDSASWRSFMVGLYVSGKLCVENWLRGPRSRFIAWPRCRSCILNPSVNGTWAVLKFRCLLAVEMASLAAAVSVPPGPAAFRSFL